MGRFRLLVVGLFLLTSSFAVSQSLDEVRKVFHSAVMEEGKSRDFHNFFKGEDKLEPIFLAYKATSEAMLARVVWNPFTKLSQVMKYADMMEEAVAEDMMNIEIRFLRLAIEYNLPKFLGMSKHLEEDRDWIVDNLSSVSTMDIDPSFSHYIIYFLNDTGLCTTDQMVEMKSVLKETEEAEVEAQ